MKTIIHALSLLLLAFAVITPTFAADKAKKKKPAPVAVKAPMGVALTADQQAKLDALNKEFGPKLAACRKEASGIITTDQKKARAAAFKAAKAAGKEGKELRAVTGAAFNVSEDQKTKLAECKKAMGTLQKEVRSKMVSILTKDQKAQLKGVKKGGDKKKKQ